ncbi:MAG: hypothetical protein QW666_01915, partial [Candidatus Woesearchaeota archaeon]
SRPIITQYAKYYISEIMLNEQLSSFELTLDQVVLNLQAMSSKIELAKKELSKTQQELIVEENKLREYQKDFREIKEGYALFYTKAKSYQNTINGSY